MEISAKEEDGSSQIPEHQQFQETMEEHVTVKVFTRRWYIIILFAFFPFFNALVSATWGPIASSANLAFGFTPSDIALVSNMGIIGYIPSFPFYAWLIKVKGIRVALLTGSSLLLTGSAMRLVVGLGKNQIWAIHLGQFITSFAVPLALVVPPEIISTWVPDNQRVTVTALLMLIASFGGAINGILGPQVVRQTLLTENITEERICVAGDSNNFSCYHHNISNVPIGATVADIQNDILILLGIQCAMIAVCTALVFIYFPAKPPLPPSISASKARMGIACGMKSLLRNRAFWMITISSCLPNACHTTTMVFLEPILARLGFNQKTVGWLLFAALTSAMVVSICLGRVMDKLKSHSKEIVVSLAALFSLSTLLFALQCVEIIAHNLGSICSNVIISGILSAVIFPLTCDVTCEIGYPVTEGLTMGVFQLFQVVVLSILLGSVMIPGFDVLWVVWVIFGLVTLSVPLFASCKIHLKRHEMDKRQKPQHETT